MTTNSSLRIVYEVVEALQPATQNPKGHNLPALRRSFERFGYVDPVVVDERTGRMVVGHGRREELMAMRAAGASAPVGIEVRDGTWMVPVVRGWSSKSDDDAQAFLLAANKITEAGGWVQDQYVEIVDALERRGAALQELGWSARELADIAEEMADRRRNGPNGEDPGPVDPPKVPVSVTGTVYQLGPHRLMCGDSTKPEDVQRLMGDERAILMATDPPYGVNYTDAERVAAERAHGRPQRAQKWDVAIDNDETVGAEIQPFLEAAFRAAVGHAVLPNAAWYLWHAQMTQGFFAAAAAAANLLLHRQIIWVKPSLLFGFGDYHWRHELAFYGWVKGNRPPFYGERNQTTVWEMGNETAAVNRNHPTQKPVEIFAIPMRNHTRTGELCYEPFSGSGSQIIAAAQEGRRCYAMEVDPRFVDAARIRWTQWARSSGIDPGDDALDPTDKAPSPTVKRSKKKTSRA